MTNKWVQIVFILFTALSICEFGQAEIFSSMSEVEELLQMEALLIDNLDTFVAEQESRLKSSAWLKYLKRKIRREHDDTFQTASDYVLDPTNTFRLMRRFTSQWKTVEQIIQQANDTEALFENIAFLRNNTKFPNDDDLNGAAIALTRLRYTYDYSWQMSPTDCFDVGKQMFIAGNYYYAKQWMNDALNMLKNSSNISNSISKVDILEYLAIVVFDQDTLLTIEIAYASLNNIEIDDAPHECDIYEKLCNGEIERDPQTLAKLKCRYDTNGSPYSKIAPFKLEEASLNPYIVIYHNVISDQEIEVLKELTKPKLERAETGLEKHISSFRISKNAWLDDDEHEIIGNIGLRVQDMTGLNVATAEALQVNNYGIGGHYEVHSDFFGVDSLPLGDRIATVMFYMSDVVRGGATVFPLINVTIKPERGSAAFWYNIFKSGEDDYSTIHAGCPVLVGSKWVANKWFHERGQEFLRPCELEPDYDDDNDDNDIEYF